MKPNAKKQSLLKELPGVDRVLEQIYKDTSYQDTPKTVVLKAIRSSIDTIRRRILTDYTEKTEGLISIKHIVDLSKEGIKQLMRPNLRVVINATGVVVHTNLGRSLLSPEAVSNVFEISRHYSNLEFDLAQGRRGSRYSAVEDLLCELSGAEAALVVNNNAGAVLLTLETIVNESPESKEVIISRGELVEIGGSFRIPDVMAKSGGILREVGTTNRTHLRDYRNAINTNTALLLKAHTSNYSIVGFTSAVTLKELVAIGNEFGVPVMEDLGSGSFIDFSQYGMLKEPTVPEAVATGADVVTFSGDKLLGGPQAGIILGRTKLLEKIKKNPLTRALRIDKMTLAGLESTLRCYRNPSTAVTTIPTLQMLTMPLAVLSDRAERLKRDLESINDVRLKIELMDLSSKAGGGSLPLQNIPSKCLGIQIDGLSTNTIEHYLRHFTPAIIGRIESERFIMDLRTILEDDFDIIRTAFITLLSEGDHV